ncbi:uncharacterized protein STEHIDRAFT_163294 [Stereum hirsutum FP-91666 SS1]|uniref:Uncharacterized protein n=1 Tax=Stereum hirsutum (strain FP-91666) TaxID=721885 RepID=R7S0I1_STEHR|nr:uncharacterized protein STEHIDRAFT_163294 [Stereum hirsutum FP-91666 SS1]EIM80047.1 hypothetical protein STEHIDRAFT_163294 [Stereum hirsutum FP-91666 SS1]
MSFTFAEDIPPVVLAQAKLSVLRELFTALSGSDRFPLRHNSFDLDPNDVADEGWTYALNRRFEASNCWGLKRNGLVISECGGKLDSTLDTLQRVIPVAEDIGIVNLWLNALLDAARNAFNRSSYVFISKTASA